MKTSEEQLQRMEALLRRMGERDIYGCDYTEARQIVAELDGSADAAVMREVLRETYGNASGPGKGPARVRDILGGKNEFWEARFALACIAKGRELALVELSK